MLTNIHFTQEGVHRTLQMEGFFEHKEVVATLVDNDIKPDAYRFMLTYTKPKT